MELTDAIRLRRMVRAFEPRALPAGTLDRILELGLHAPSAGFSQGWAFVVLEGPDQTSRYWDVTLPSSERDRFPWPGLLDAPVLVIPLAHAQAYVDRYAEADKAGTGLGRAADDWPVPYWLVDTAMSSMLMLLGAVDEGLGALFFGIFDHEAELMADLGVPEGYRPIGTIAIGYGGEGTGADRPSRSLDRGRRPLAEVVHRGGW
ncbi:MAG TPA: nitroreductase family protein [Acidimicrobiales bacterium]